MSSYRQNFYHIIIGTKSNERVIPDKYCLDLYKYIWGFTKNKNCKLYQINGTEDHIHILTDIHPSICLADFIKGLKRAAGDWLKEHPEVRNFKGWRSGYGSFTVSFKEKSAVIQYIKNQKIHHRKESFYDEYKRLLDEHGVSFDEKYMLCD
ncbi:IS200/IS605 family transposase [Mongoliitalea daihaiensis]|uniref:IS200/IS605 family transposase n=1 Tax=Mongoliitalea daihaiensis TaxID=2782006 RepID=UPI001F45AE32|nr:IS200/IS605 family transposase [Mongoliitalea daihaiensis]UJP65284.1 IS200/IS605 family transposase [Mongoliitalea daihaiensis]